jgi:hypothetical protein
MSLWSQEEGGSSEITTTETPQKDEAGGEPKETSGEAAKP